MDDYIKTIGLSTYENIKQDIIFGILPPLKPIFEIDFNFSSKDPLMETVAIDVLISQLHKFFCF